jgi:hypothetical protein
MRTLFNLPRPGEWPSFKKELRARRHFQIDRFLDEDIAKRISKRADRSAFKKIGFDRIGYEWSCRDFNLAAGLNLMFNDPKLFEFVSRVSGEPRIRFFSGRLYRLDSGLRSGFAWHSDNIEGRRMGLSLNLGHDFEGGEFEIRLKSSERLLGTVANIKLGSALFFSIGPGLQHRVHPVTGAKSKVSFAGWFFRSRPKSFEIG